jgi:diguanylate cyclase (GGDEF)-like protein/PAS domain S-box-containing protein
LASDPQGSPGADQPRRRGASRGAAKGVAKARASPARRKPVPPLPEAPAAPAPPPTDGVETLTRALTEAQGRFQATQERLERVLAASPTVLYALAVEGDSLGLTWVSPNVQDMLGYPVEEALEPHWWSNHIHPDDRALASTNLGQLFSEGGLRHEYRLRHKSGRYVWLRDELQLRRDSKGRAVEVYGSWADITERREVEAERQRSQAELESRVGERTAELRATNERLQFELTERRRAEEASRQSEERLQIVTRATNDAIWDWDLHTDAVLWNQGVQTLFGYAPSDVGPTAAWWTEQMHPQDRDRVRRGIAAALEGDGRSWSAEYRFRRNDGSYASVLDRGHVLRDEAGRPLRMIGSIIDITERRRAEEALHDANLKLTAQVTEMEQRNREMWLLGEMTAVLQTSNSADEAATVIATHARQLFAGDAGALYLFRHSRTVLEPAAAWGDVMPEDHGFERDDCWALRRGRTHLVDGSGSGLRCPHVTHVPAQGYLCIPMAVKGEHLGLLHLGSEVTRLDEARQRFAQTVAESVGLGISNLRLSEALRNQAIRDPLTGLFNRRFMVEALERELRRATRRLTPLSVIMLDLDHFKLLNDTSGHEAGDALLRDLGAYLLRNVRAGDVACRYGGEEFMLILPDAPQGHAKERAEALRDGVRTLGVRDAVRGGSPITVSAGVASFPEHGATADELLRAADAALYVAKQQGRDRVVSATV